MRVTVNKGQTLIEVLVAIGLVGLALSAIVLGATVSIKTARVSRERTAARNLVGQKFEEVRNARELDPEGFFALGTRQEIATTTDVGVNYTLTTDYTLEVADGRMRVDVRAEWSDGGNSFSVEETSYLTQR